MNSLNTTTKRQSTIIKGFKEISFVSFCEKFPFYGDKVFAEVLEQHQDVIKTQKARFALNNLKKLFDAAFEISLQSGFDKMSLPELSNEARMSMGEVNGVTYKPLSVNRAS